MADALQTPGQRLAEARAGQNLAAADVARQLKLSLWQIEALEAGRYQQLPGPIFVRGFIRNYARIVKLDPEELLRTAGENLPQSTAHPETPPSRDIPFPTERPPRWPGYAAAAVAIFGALAIYEFVWNEPERAEQRAVAVAPTAPAEQRAPKPAAAPPEARSLQTEAVAAPAPVAAEGKPADQPSALPVAQPTTEITATAPAVERAPKRGEKLVRLNFDQESWVEIRDRNERVIFSQLNRPGTAQKVIGLPPLSIVVGNAHGVRMTYDDQPVDLASYTKIDVARLILP